MFHLRYLWTDCALIWLVVFLRESGFESKEKIGIFVFFAHSWPFSPFISAPNCKNYPKEPYGVSKLRESDESKWQGHEKTSEFDSAHEIPLALISQVALLDKK